MVLPANLFFIWHDASADIHLLLIFLCVATVTTLLYLMCRSRTVYLVDYACFRPHSNYRISKAACIENIHHSRSYDDSGKHRFLTPRAEAELSIFTTIDDLLLKTCIDLDAIAILVVNCSLFNPIPCLADMIMRRYKLRDNICNVQLSGMGCSAGLIAVGLAKDLLHNAPSSAHALVVSTEILTGVSYTGKKREMQLTNMLFRMGGSAVLLSTSSNKARFELTHVVRNCTSSQDNAYRCVSYEEDDERIPGLNLSKDLVHVAGKDLTANITTVGPLILPLSVKIAFLLSFISQKVLNGTSKPYVPDFCKAFEHLCIHAGGNRCCTTQPWSA
uniref:FAE domain-containing protein n=1 Tax=Hordeum vulgare subsp. vulgare TaxID=112509 RepID=A0A8I6Y942_HORVV